MDRALIQAAVSGSAARRHSLTNASVDDQQLDYFLQRYNSLRAAQSGGSSRRPTSLDRAYKSAIRNSLSNQTLQGASGGGSLAQRKLEAILASRGARSVYDAYSDTEAYETPSSLMHSRRTMTPSSLLGKFESLD